MGRTRWRRQGIYFSSSSSAWHHGSDGDSIFHICSTCRAGLWMPRSALVPMTPPTSLPVHYFSLFTLRMCPWCFVVGVIRQNIGCPVSFKFQISNKYF